MGGKVKILYLPKKPKTLNDKSKHKVQCVQTGQVKMARHLTRQYISFFLYDTTYLMFLRKMFPNDVQ